ncbi:hypothetical protein [Alkalicoccus saliphilus]|nr:hypothetical protein [Alkalicoccus saliphilus]
MNKGKKQYVFTFRETIFKSTDHEKKMAVEPSFHLIIIFFR